MFSADLQGPVVPIERIPVQGPALDRTHANQPLSPGHASQQTHDYKRNGTATLFVALDLLTGKVSANAFYQRPTNSEFVDFLGLGCGRPPGR